MYTQYFTSKLLNKTLFILGFLFGITCFSQTTPNLEGEYFIKENKSNFYILNKNEFVILGYATIIKGKIEIVNNELKFKTDHPNNEFLLYGRSSSDKKILFDQNILRYRISMGNSYTKEEETLLHIIQKDENDYNCRSNKLFLPNNKGTDLLLTSEADENLLTYFHTGEKYNDLFLEYSQADPDVSFLNEVFDIKNGKLNFDPNLVLKAPLDIPEEVKKMITNIDKVDAIFNKNTLYLNQDYEVLVSEKIDFRQYSYNELTHQYNRKSLKHDNTYPKIIYKYVKLNPIIHTNHKYKLDKTSFLNAKCFKTPKALWQENENKKTKQTTYSTEIMSPQ